MSDKEDIRVKMRVGDLELEVEGPPTKIYELVSKLVGNLGSGDKNISMQPKVKKSCKDVIEDLWREGWFEKERRLSEVYVELSSRGYNFDKSAISHALASLTRDGKLRRIGKERKYRYIQKYPYNQLVKNK